MSNTIGEIAVNFMFVRDQLKLYHWSTTNYARHIASDTLVNNLSLKMDRFMEVIQGTENKRLSLKNKPFVYKKETDKSIIKLLENFKNWLSYTLPKHINKKNTDLFNIRDDILSDVNNTLYLFTFS